MVSDGVILVTISLVIIGRVKRGCNFIKHENTDKRRS